MGRCFYHYLELREPALFESYQPTLLLLDQAKFGLPDSEPDNSRARDRHQQASERREFLLDEAA